MRNIVLGFSFMTLLILFLAVISHTGVGVGFLTGKAAISDFYLITPISVMLLLLNTSIVYGLKKNQKWAYVLGGLEMIFLFFGAAINSWMTGFSNITGNLIYALISLSLLWGLKNDYENLSEPNERHV